MNKRHFLLTGAAAGLLPAAAPAAPAQGRADAGPALLTVSGAIGKDKANRGPVDPWRDLLMVKHGVAFETACELDAAALRRLPAQRIEPTLEYDARPHALAGPLLTAVLAAAGVDLKAELRVALRAVDGYAVEVSLRELQAWRTIVATELDGRPLALGGLGPQWAVHDPAAIPGLRDRPLKERFAACPWALYHVGVARA